MSCAQPELAKIAKEIMQARAVDVEAFTYARMGAVAHAIAEIRGRAQAMDEEDITG